MSSMHESSKKPGEGSPGGAASDRDQATLKPGQEKAVRKAFPLRLPAPLLDALQHWADDELRSLNGQIEYVLREALKRSGRWRSGGESSVSTAPGSDGGDKAESPEPR